MGLVLSLDVPGVKAKDLQVETKADTHRYRHRVLEISGTRKMMNGTDETFVRGFTIDERVADVSKMTANLADGVLVVTIPKCTEEEEESKPRTIEISENPHPEVSTANTTEATAGAQEETEGDVDIVLVSKEDKKQSLSEGTK